MSNIFDSFNDDLDSHTLPTEAERAEARNKAVHLPAAPERTVPCGRCGGRGKAYSYSSGRLLGDCFTCKGTGKITARQDGARRAKVTRELNDQAKRAAFVREHEAELQWLNRVANREETRMGMPPFTYWEFPVELRNGLVKYGTLTEGQIGAIRKCMARDEARKAERAAQAPAADTTGVDRLKAAFDAAIAYSAQKGLKLAPRITVGGMTIKPAKATSANPGALYVTEGETYLGKVKDGRFFASRECSQEASAKVLGFIADPAEAAKVYGQTTGTCCVCNATLRSEWKHRGIGPICAEKFGW